MRNPECHKWEVLVVLTLQPTVPRALSEDGRYAYPISEEASFENRRNRICAKEAGGGNMRS